MTLTIKHQDVYSRLELILRTLFGFIYILIPHYFILVFLAIAGFILKFLSFWVVLFTGRYPESFFNFQVELYRWTIRLIARMYNVLDGYPSFGLKAVDDGISFEVPYPEKLSRLLLIVRILFGFIYVIIPHFFILFFRGIATFVLIFLAWWIVLFTGKFPESFHKFIVGTLRWNMRVSVYLGFMSDEYPPFSGKE
jgi:hypothetical protein